ncbi:MAG: hypothetical protein KDC14_00535, partial [Planctomycetes bacterium]|nr:hypothetical protein [Planctomycetota bacterium]
MSALDACFLDAVAEHLVDPSTRLSGDRTLWNGSLMAVGLEPGASQDGDSCDLEGPSSLFASITRSEAGSCQTGIVEGLTRINRDLVPTAIQAPTGDAERIRFCRQLQAPIVTQGDDEGFTSAWWIQADDSPARSIAFSSALDPSLESHVLDWWIRAEGPVVEQLYADEGMIVFENTSAPDLWDVHYMTENAVGTASLGIARDVDRSMEFWRALGRLVRFDRSREMRAAVVRETLIIGDARKVVTSRLDITGQSCSGEAEASDCLTLFELEAEPSLLELPWDSLVAAASEATEGRALSEGWSVRHAADGKWMGALLGDGSTVVAVEAGRSPGAFWHWRAPSGVIPISAAFEVLLRVLGPIGADSPTEPSHLVFADGERDFGDFAYFFDAGASELQRIRVSSGNTPPEGLGAFGEIATHKGFTAFLAALADRSDPDDSSLFHRVDDHGGGFGVALEPGGAHHFWLDDAKSVSPALVELSPRCLDSEMRDSEVVFRAASEVWSRARPGKLDCAGGQHLLRVGDEVLIADQQDWRLLGRLPSVLDGIAALLLDEIVARLSRGESANFTASPHQDPSSALLIFFGDTADDAWVVATDACEQDLHTWRIGFPRQGATQALAVGVVDRLRASCPNAVMHVRAPGTGGARPLDLFFFGDALVAFDRAGGELVDLGPLERPKREVAERLSVRVDQIYGEYFHWPTIRRSWVPDDGDWALVQFSLENAPELAADGNLFGTGAATWQLRDESEWSESSRSDSRIEAFIEHAIDELGAGSVPGGEASLVNVDGWDFLLTDDALRFLSDSGSSWTALPGHDLVHPETTLPLLTRAVVDNLQNSTPTLLNVSQIAGEPAALLMVFSGAMAASPRVIFMDDLTAVSVGEYLVL